MHHVGQWLNEQVAPFRFFRWNGEPATERTCYFVGEYTETANPARLESGKQETTLILRGYTRGPHELLEEAKRRLEKTLPAPAVLADGTGVAILYQNGFFVPTGDAELKSIKINLAVKEWRGGP